jgi:hypothetical protein
MRVLARWGFSLVSCLLSNFEFLISSFNFSGCPKVPLLKAGVDPEDSDAAQQGEAADGKPFGNENVTAVKEDSRVRRDELPGSEFVARLLSA